MTSKHVVNRSCMLLVLAGSGLATTMAYAIDAPKDLRGTEVAQSAVKWEWASVPGAVYYEITVDDSYKGITRETLYISRDLWQGDHSMVVRAVEANGNSSVSTETAKIGVNDKFNASSVSRSTVVVGTEQTANYDYDIVPVRRNSTASDDDTDNSVSTIELAANDVHQACLPIQDEPVPFGQVNKAMMQHWMPDLRYIVNPQHLSIDTGFENQSAIRQKFEPTNIGSDRVVASIDITGQQTYALSQSVLFEDGFDWGGTSESGKFGFGLGGGSTPTGGDARDDGLSARLIWQGNGDGTAGLGVYAYSADRSQNLPWGDVFNVENFQIPVGEWFRITLVVTANSTVNSHDGSLSVLLDNEVVMWKDNIQWQGSGVFPEVDQLIYSSFYGGNTAAWAPDYTTHARFSNVCLSAEAG
ncbi:polysaccharide lyase [Granulosicoccus antarcticus]|uniref:Polysaccharide lyase 14 domain-containing protein n=1 Tax=Granulosicoccus antarcticus IMCC3135 TaxID=1192854 RepID=A0A2Z2NSK3_9GAMM|nr:hypothetical protein [Granulosicoccus antarcticus]ASJ74536.1 hypothetical protein IMCC3135_22330 [Granulosicoccus antarcticus IMCC3135]